MLARKQVARPRRNDYMHVSTLSIVEMCSHVNTPCRRFASICRRKPITHIPHNNHTTSFLWLCCVYWNSHQRILMQTKHSTETFEHRTYVYYIICMHTQLAKQTVHNETYGTTWQNERTNTHVKFTVNTKATTVNLIKWGSIISE